jgi:hypothetical protein
MPALYYTKFQQQRREAISDKNTCMCVSKFYISMAPECLNLGYHVD